MANANLGPSNIAAELRGPAAKLRQMAQTFAGTNFTDRYGDGPMMLAHAERLDFFADALDATLAFIRIEQDDIAWLRRIAERAENEAEFITPKDARRILAGLLL